MSFENKRLLVIAVIIIILVVAADQGNRQDIQVERIARNIVMENRAFSRSSVDPATITDSPTQNSKTALVDPSNQKITLPTTPVSISPVSSAPVISAESYLVGNLDTGEVYIKHSPQSVFPIASISKLITALVARKDIPSDKKITITQDMLDAYGDAGHLVLGETLTQSELMYPLLLESSNDAAEALAQSYGYGSFIQAMNTFVANLGMSHTSFRDASGLSSGNISSASDLFILARYLYMTEKPLLDITRQPTMSLASTTDHGAHVFNTINPFPLDPNFLGGKTGRTDEAKESMISLFRYNNGLKTYPIVIIVLRSDFSVRQIDSSILFEQFTDKIQ